MNFSSYVLCGHVFGERAWEAPNRGRSDAIGPGDFDQAFTLGKPFHGFLPLVLVELSGAAKLHATGFGALPAVVCAGFDQMALERGKAGKDRHQQLTLWRRSIAPRIMQRLELGAFLAELLSGCYAGRLDGLELKHLEQYAKALMEPEYTDDLRCLGLLYECLRHKVAHLAYPYPVIRHRKSGRLLTWSIHEKEGRSAIKIVDYLPRNMWWVRTTRPWPVSYDCRIEVWIGSLAIDIVKSISGYLQHLKSYPKAQKYCAKCMREYFPT